MDISLTELKEKEIVNVFDGKKLGHIVDILFDIENGLVRGIVVPGERKLFRKNDDIFIPLEKLKKIGDDVVLVKLQTNEDRGFANRYKYQDSKKHKLTNYYNFSYENNGVNQAMKERENQKKLISTNKGQSQSNYTSYVRFKPINNKKYK